MLLGHHDLRMALCTDGGCTHRHSMSLRVSSLLLLTTPRLFLNPVLIAMSSFGCGAYVALLANPVLEFGDAEDGGRRVGMMFSILSIGAVAGPPISGAISTATGGYEDVGYWAGKFFQEAT
jgi:MFS family permease